jgi:hypothetical protein
MLSYLSLYLSSSSLSPLISLLIQFSHTISIHNTLFPSPLLHCSHIVQSYRTVISYSHIVQSYRTVISYSHFVQSYRTVISYSPIVQSYRTVISYSHIVPVLVCDGACDSFPADTPDIELHQCHM